MDRETRNRIIDFWDPWDLVEFLQVNTEDVVDAFEAEIEELIDEIEELMGISKEEDEEE